jgi:hypothetical protein
MNFKSLIVVGLGIATLGLSLPAHADTATSVTNDQDAFVTGYGNVTTQTNQSKVSNRERGRRSDSTGTIVNNRQAADIAGDENLTVQDNKTTVRNDSDSRHRRYRY